MVLQQFDVLRFSIAAWLLDENCLELSHKVLEQAFNMQWWDGPISLIAHIRQDTKLDFEPYTKDICEFVLTDPGQILALFDDVCDDTTLIDLIKWGQEVVEETQKATNYADICAWVMFYYTKEKHLVDITCNAVMIKIKDSVKQF
ncbi:unnamed protein product [Clavelina lepadiformis]|uniref:Uncharacterized protein n=1 Tax=Clavelina lepadiformis TaxID=159417 RepID=A0ABP0FD43_CLALP